MFFIANVSMEEAETKFMESASLHTNEEKKNPKPKPQHTSNGITNVFAKWCVVYMNEAKF